MDIKKRVVIDRNIPYLECLDTVFDTVRLSPDEINRHTMADADALITRTRTRCDATLLDGSRCSFVGTATIGTDHIDLDYCRDHGIEVVSAPGCNAPAVAQYVWASILTLRPHDWQPLTMGIIGLGHVGSLVADWARRLGVKVLACDPPRKRAQGGWNAMAPFEPGCEKFVSLDEIAATCDVITIHTPHTKTGAYATHHLADNRFFGGLQRNPVVVNAARGPIVDTEAVLSAVRERKISGCVIDCWEGEPAINRELLQVADIATPHIAGYSIEGKRRATTAVVSAALAHFGAKAAADVFAKANGVASYGREAQLSPQEILASYNPLSDSELLKNSFTPATFEQLRNRYPLRHEVGFTIG